MTRVRENTYEAASRQDNRLNRWFHESPKPAFRRGKTMRDELVRSKLLTKSVRTREIEQFRKGVTRCMHHTSRQDQVQYMPLP